MEFIEEISIESVSNDDTDLDVWRVPKSTYANFLSSLASNEYAGNEYAKWWFFRYSSRKWLALTCLTMTNGINNKNTTGNIWITKTK